MNRTQFEYLKELIYETENASMMYGRCKEREDSCQSHNMAPILREITIRHHAFWGEKTSKLHDFLETLVEE